MAGLFGEPVNRRPTLRRLRRARLFATKPQVQENLSAKTGGGVEYYIMNGPGARRQKSLVPFVETGYQCGHGQRGSRPNYRPARVVFHHDGGAPGAKKQKTQDGVANYVARLPDQEMPGYKSDRAQAEKKVENRIQEPAGVLRGKRSGGFDGDHSQPD